MTVVVRAVRFEALYTGSGWLEPAWVSLDQKGCIVALSQTPPKDLAVPTTRFDGYAIPGLVNSHSHAFQFAMAGLSEHVAPGAENDDFWTWRDAMYKLANQMTPESMQKVATTLYRALLRRGFTRVVEFHYLHHDAKGRAYADPAEMSARLVAAAHEAGMALSLVPIFYNQGGFNQPPKPSQARFIAPSVDAYLRLVEAARRHTQTLADATCGMGVHSLRAASASDIAAIAKAMDEQSFFHIHAAEQMREVDECRALLGKRPVRWLLDEIGLDRRFALTHCTHMDADEVRDLARSGATAVVCPSTEGNLGDGFFEARAYLAEHGSMAIGTDSHVGLSAAEELRWLDYGQRMRDRRRNVLCRPGEDSAAVLWQAAFDGGRAAAGLPAQSFWAKGEALDAVVLDPHHPVIASKPAERRLAAFVHAAGSEAILAVLRRGESIALDQRVAE